MQKEITAAVKAANAYKIRNEGERASVEMIRSMLADISTRLPLLDGFAEGHDRVIRVRAAEDELRAAQAGVLGPDTQLKP